MIHLIKSPILSHSTMSIKKKKKWQRHFAIAIVHKQTKKCKVTNCVDLWDLLYECVKQKKNTKQTTPKIPILFKIWHYSNSN